MKKNIDETLILFVSLVLHSHGIFLFFFFLIFFYWTSAPLLFFGNLT